MDSDTPAADVLLAGEPKPSAAQQDLSERPTGRQVIYAMAVLYARLFILRSLHGSGIVTMSSVKEAKWCVENLTGRVLPGSDEPLVATFGLPLGGPTTKPLENASITRISEQ